MGRQMVGQRKGGAPSVPVQDEQGPGDDESGNSAEQSGESADSGVVECPNCKCQFNENDPKDIVKPGLPVQSHDAGGSGYGGADLDSSGSAQPMVGQKGTAWDGSIGTQASTNALASLFGGPKGGGVRM